MEDNLFEEIKPNERAILIGIWDRRNLYEQALEFLDELAFLVTTAGAKPVHSLIQKTDKPKAGTYVGTGKLMEIKALGEEHQAKLVVFDNELTPTQLRNIEEGLEMRVIDRTGIILHIFSLHAQTAQARTQVELARLEYLLPRLTGMWSHLGRERGGIGLKGAGEKEIETDRRIIRTKMARLREDLEKIDRQNQTRRKSRDPMVRVALVGYTNVGKSTLMNRLSKSDVLVENKLFATLDTTVRKVVYNNVPFLLSDTVGFIRKLPHKLVESFKSTLDEVREADLLMHVVDVSNMYYLDHIDVVNRTLAELEAQEKPTLMVFNKIDRITEQDLEDLRRTWELEEKVSSVFISASNNRHIDDLRELLLQLVEDRYRYKYPNMALSKINWG